MGSGLRRFGGACAVSPVGLVKLEAAHRCLGASTAQLPGSKPRFQGVKNVQLDRSNNAPPPPIKRRSNTGQTPVKRASPQAGSRPCRRCQRGGAAGSGGAPRGRLRGAAAEEGVRGCGVFKTRSLSAAKGAQLHAPRQTGGGHHRLGQTNGSKSPKKTRANCNCPPPNLFPNTKENAAHPAPRRWAT